MYGGRTRGRFGGLAPARWDFMSLSLLVLGIGSFLFHATLRQTMQLVDDVSMLLLAWSMLQSVCAVRQTPTLVWAINTGLTVSVCAFAAFYVWTGEILYHTFGFLTMMSFLTGRSRYIIHWMEPRLAGKERRWNSRTWLSMFWTMFGYVLWTIDLEFCKELRELRTRVGLPWAWVLELHGWWHVLTAMGASQFMEIAREMREEAKREEAKREKRE